MKEHCYLDKEKKTLLIPIASMDQSLEPVKEIIQLNNFRIKPEFHLTLIGYALGRVIRDHLYHQAKNSDEVYAAINALCAETNFRIHPKQEWFHIGKEYRTRDGGKEYRESIIVLVDVDELTSFWNKLETILGKSLPLPFAHVTLATRGSGSPDSFDGIAIKDEQDFINLEKQKIEL